MSDDFLVGPESPLRVNIENRELVIRVGINYLDGHEAHDSIPALKFDDRLQWVRDVICEIEQEEEDGSTPLTMMLDAAMEAALENGSIGISEDSFTFIGVCPVCESDCVPLRHTKKGVRCEDCS